MYIRHVITREDIPDWVPLTADILEKIAQDSDDLLPWLFSSKRIIKGSNDAIRIHYPSRQLFAFAYREDCDEVACFERNKPGKVVIISNWEVEGFEVGPEFVSFDAWYNYALSCENGHIDYTNIPGIDFNPYEEK